MAGRDAAQRLALPEFDSRPRLLIVAAPYQKEIVNLLMLGAVRMLERAADFERIEVPGALEIPAAVRIAGSGGKFDGFVALGCVIRGDTTHYETVCAESARGLTILGSAGWCIGNGILTLENLEQGLVRADPDQQDKGGEAAAAALHLVALSKRFGGKAGSLGFQLRQGRTTGAGQDPK